MILWLFRSFSLIVSAVFFFVLMTALAHAVAPALQSFAATLGVPLALGSLQRFVALLLWLPLAVAATVVHMNEPIGYASHWFRSWSSARKQVMFWVTATLAAVVLSLIGFWITGSIRVGRVIAVVSGLLLAVVVYTRRKAEITTPADVIQVFGGIPASTYLLVDAIAKE